MQFNELLEQYSIKEISQRTRVAPENIEHLQGGDWEMMRKVQALGFISIIEREFGVDLSELRQECLNYYREHQQGLGGERYELHADNRTLYANILPKILIALFVIVALVGSWYAFVQKNPDLSSKVNQKKSNQGFYDSVINVAKNIVEDNNSNITKISETKELTPPKKSKKSIAVTTNDNSSKIKSNLLKEGEKLKLEYAKKPEENKKETQESKILSKEENKKIEKTLKITDIIPESTSISSSNSKKTLSKDDKKDTNSQESDKTVNDKIDNNIEVVSLLPEVPSLSKKRDDKQAKSAENSDNKKATNGAAVVILTPRSKVWIGFRELRSGKRTAEVVQKDQAITFDTTKSDYILATGHGVLTFTNGDEKELLKLHDGKKHFFMIAKGGVREISHEKFQKLNGSKVW